MTNRFLESCEGVSTITQLAGAAANDTTTKWRCDAVPASNFTLVAGKVKVTGGSISHYIGRDLPFTAGSGQPVVVGFKYTPAAITGTAETLYLDTILGNGNLQLVRSTSELALLNANNLRGTTAGLGLVAGTEYAIEVKAVFVSGTNWTVTVRVNGVVKLTVTNANFGSATFTKFSFGGGALGTAGSNDQFGDIYIDDTDFITGGGAWNVLVSPPSGNGAHSDGVNSAGNSTNNYSYVDEVSVNDADYVQFTNDGDEDTYAHTDITFTSGYAVRAVQVNTRAAYLSGAKHIAHVARLGTTEEVGADQTLQAALAWNGVVFPLDPVGNAWTPTNVNASEFGMKQTA